MAVPLHFIETCKRCKMKETDIAKPVVSWLQDQGWTVYQEVEVKERGARADIVAIIEPKIWVIEVKRSYGLGVLEQALSWRSLSHYVSIAVPRGKRGQRTHLATGFIAYRALAGCVWGPGASTHMLIRK